MKALQGKTVITVKDVPGFYVNRSCVDRMLSNPALPLLLASFPLAPVAPFAQVATSLHPLSMCEEGSSL